jgi:hypothetical protein
VAYVIAAVPEVTPFTTPLVEPTVATEVLLLVQLPPNVASLKVRVELTHTAEPPVIPAGIELTVAVAVVAQPVPSV